MRQLTDEQWAEILEVLEEYTDLIIDDPENPSYRACCFAGYSYTGIHTPEHTKDCAAYNLLKRLKDAG